jgi:hypothetical protein
MHAGYSKSEVKELGRALADDAHNGSAEENAGHGCPFQVGGLHPLAEFG